jgi:cytochrome oxidase Cu insertion factor (SCO1/SenC/PrrC family)
MALLQAWPGRGFWQGTAHGQASGLADMVQSMAATSQPRALASLVSAFGNFTAAHGFAVNLVAVIALAAIGAAFCVSALGDDARLARIAVLAAAVFCLADWVLIEDLGFFGGVGTDPNSMIPLILLFTAGYLAMSPAPQPEPAAAATAEDAGPATDAQPDAPAKPPSRLPAWLTTAGLRFAGLSGWSIAALGAIGVIVVGAAPMAFASANRNADPIIAQALAGASGAMNEPAPSFTLTSQDGHQVSLSSLRGKVVLLTFLDPVCTTDCPIIAQELRAADAMLGAKAGSTELVAVVANPTYTSTAFTAAFTRQEGLSQVSNWLYLTGSLSQLVPVWHQYGIEVQNLPAGAMSAHNDLAFVISAAGRLRQEISDDPGPGTAATQSSFAGLLANSVLQVMG